MNGRTMDLFSVSLTVILLSMGILCMLIFLKQCEYSLFGKDMNWLFVPSTL